MSGGVVAWRGVAEGGWSGRRAAGRGEAHAHLTPTDPVVAPLPPPPRCCRPRTFDLDAATLERAYKRLQTGLHPDKFATAGPEERAHSAEQSARVNAAYAILKSPLRRARYLVRGQGGAGWMGEGVGRGPARRSRPRLAHHPGPHRPPPAPTHHPTRPAHPFSQLHGDAEEGEHTLADPGLLAEVMAAREAVEDADAAGLVALAADHRAREAALVAQLSAAFAAGDADAAADLTTRLRYVTRVLQAITDRQ